ncbi:PREDICTED: cuticle protein 21.3-like [Acromyrmex echinatior]|uniref:Cuticle protein LPCP-23 n=1 Tax=Acromyrmex echinatior TaxID=103372 RepID=F4WEC1_ACREC|nr:PREDICTED: cuticle protein 21.3-like [Acromyrmex echinatior]EGI67559.1 Cuticle protein LPCP-23 [Acromyrmex echinatior]
MAFKFLLLAAFVAVASAGGPAAYDIGTLSADHSSIGYTQESTQKGYAGQNVVSSYSRAEDSAHSSVRVSNSHVSNDALLEQHAIGYSYAAPALAKPLIAAQPLIAKTAYAAAPAVATYTAHPAPLLAKSAYAAAPTSGYPPAHRSREFYSYASPFLAKTYAAPAPLIAKTAAYTTYTAPATPLIAKTAYAAPLAAPLLAKSYAAAPIAAAPALAYSAHTAPLIAKTYAAPYSYETAAPVVHATFSGFGTSYAW